ncbi:hypothetical protein [Mesorhizobium sp. M1252]|uniref:hypothetical protein n=1 Tax=Mesorhizobium sp. M1252 TaxID=2957073 RepID=UPI00333609E0
MTLQAADFSEDRCMACRLKIEHGAEKCPHCGTSQKKSWWGNLGNASTVLAIITGLASIATFLVVGLPALTKQVTENRAIVAASFVGGGSSPGEAGYVEILFVNYGLRSAIVFKRYPCYSYTEDDKQVVDSSGQSYPEIFITTADNTTVDGQSTKIIRFDSQGGLPLPEGSQQNVKITYQLCDLQIVDISDVTKPGAEPRIQRLQVKVPV